MSNYKYHTIVYFLVTIMIFSACGQNSDTRTVNAAALLESYNKRMNSLAIAIESSTNAPDLRQSAVQELVELTDSCVDLMQQAAPPEDQRNVHGSAMKVYKTVQAELIPIARSLSQIERPEQAVTDYTRRSEQYNVSYAKIEALIAQAMEQAMPTP